MKGCERMRKEIINRYVLIPGIDTLSIKTSNILNENISPQVADCIKSMTDNKGVKRIIINPNNFYRQNVTNYVELLEIMGNILTELNISDYELTRCDMSFDSYDNCFFDSFAKLNKYLISAVSVTYKVQNNFKTNDLFSNKLLSIAIKSSDFEMENYNKAEKSKRTNDINENVTSRLELRTKTHNHRALTLDDLPTLFLIEWVSRLEKSVSNISLVHEKYNAEIVGEYQEKKNKKQTQFRTLTDFLLSNTDRIFCTAQMRKLMSMLGTESPQRKADNFKQRYKTEYFSKSDLKRAIAEIRNSMTKFFG